MKYLIDPSNAPQIPGIDVPNDLYWVLDDPASLAGMRKPNDSTPWPDLARFGFSKVINLREAKPSYNPAPLEIAHSVQLQDLFGGGDPRDEAREKRLIDNAVEILLNLLSNGEGALVHCHEGRGRTGTVLGCALVRLGFDPEDVISALNKVHQARGKEGWPESEWQARIVREFV